ncbi:MAG: carboxymuconolactone decarboxylase family protein [Salinivirgaceae bacterium]|nr:carboxymuconolactone decarboxylase family protein [Salinivirgaceae bacterium]
MEARINYSKTAPEAIKGLLEIEKYVANSGLERTLYELVKIRASQINGCAYCIVELNRPLWWGGNLR